MKLWNDEKFILLSKDSKLAFLFVLTHPNLTSLGAMRGTVEGLAAEIEVESSAFDPLIEAELIKVDRVKKIICLPNFLRYNKPESPNVVISWGKGFDLLPESQIKTDIYIKTKEIIEGLGKGFQKAFLKSLPEDYHKAYAEDLWKDLSKSGTGTGATTLEQDRLFEIFWDAYPKKRNKGQAKATWDKLFLAGSIPEMSVLLDSIAIAKTSRKWIKDKGQYIPYPSTWLNAAGWDDEVTCGAKKEERRVWVA